MTDEIPGICMYETGTLVNASEQWHSTETTAVPGRLCPRGHVYTGDTCDYVPKGSDPAVTANRCGLREGDGMKDTMANPQEEAMSAYERKEALDRLRKFERAQRQIDQRAQIRARSSRDDAWIVRTVALSCTLSLVSVVIMALLLIFR